MRILVVAPQPFFTPRGTPFSVYYRALVMSELGVSIDLLSYGVGQDIDVAGVRTIRIPRIRFLEPIPIGPSWKKLFLDLIMVFWTIGLLTKHRYPVVHAHEEAVFWCRPLKWIFGFRLIYDMHSSLPQQLDNFKFTKSSLLVRIFRSLEDSALRAADAVITICPDLRDYALKSGVLPARHVLIENSIYDDVRLKAQPAGIADGKPRVLVNFSPAEIVILYAGTFEAYQGIEILVQAFAQLVPKRPDARLLLVGGTDKQVDQIAALVAKLGLVDTCILTGHVSKSAAMKYMQFAHVLVSPRIHGTNTPLKIYEQLASRKPLVVTRIWSHTQVLDDRVCYLVDPEAASLARGLHTALDDLGRTTERPDNALALYNREYARPVYESKMRRLLEIVA